MNWTNLPLIAFQFLLFGGCIAFALSWIHKEELKLRVIAIVVGFVLIVLATVALAYQNSVDKNDQNMQQSVGIINDMEYRLVISKNIDVTGELNGTMFLFTGSINNIKQDDLRIEYVAPDGNSYLLNVPKDKIVYFQNEYVLPSGRFHFNSWDKNKTLQGNVDENLKEIKINLTPDEYQKLIQ